MAKVMVECNRFSGSFSSLNGIRTRDFSRRAFFRSLVTVGFQRFPEVFLLGWRGIQNRFGIAISTSAYIENKSGYLCVSSGFFDLEQSEKTVSSFWHGMAFAKLVSESELSIPWLGYVDRMKASGALTTTSLSNERGDLVGRDRQSRWHVVEAKGRSNPYPSSLIDSAKRQAASVLTINNQPPQTTTACISSLFSSPISILMDDPRPEPREGRRWSLSDDRFFLTYYRPVIDYISENGGRREDIAGRSYMVAPLFPYRWDIPSIHPENWEAWRLELGLQARIFDSPTRAGSLIDDLRGNSEVTDDGEIGPDGIAIIGQMPDWEGSRA